MTQCMRHRVGSVVMLALLLVLLATPAWAAEPAGKEPDLLEAMIDWKAILVAIITFLILVVLLTKLAWKPILTGLQEREETIRRAVDDAQKASEEARALAASYQQKLDAATEKAREINEDARKSAEALKVQIEEDARKQAEATLARSVKEIEQAKDTAFDELLKDVTSIATEAAALIVQRDLTLEDNARLVDGVVDDFVKSRDGDGA